MRRDQGRRDSWRVRGRWGCSPLLESCHVSVSLSPPRNVYIFIILPETGPIFWHNTSHCWEEPGQTREHAGFSDLVLLTF